MFLATAETKDMFFDRLKVQAMVEPDARKALGRMGAFIRITARRSQRPGGKKRISAKPGEPPRVHSKDKFATLKNIYYAYKEVNGNPGVVVGPRLINGSKNTNPTVPEVQEKGGAIRVAPKKKKSLLSSLARPRVVNIAPHPYMEPALEKAEKRFEEFWYGSTFTADVA